MFWPILSFKNWRFAKLLCVFLSVSPVKSKSERKFNLEKSSLMIIWDWYLGWFVHCTNRDSKIVKWLIYKNFVLSSFSWALVFIGKTSGAWNSPSSHDVNKISANGSNSLVREWIEWLTYSKLLRNFRIPQVCMWTFYN